MKYFLTLRAIVNYNKTTYELICKKAFGWFIG
jgi:hypothetical protein